MALLNVSENMNVIFKRRGNEKVNTDEGILAFYFPQKNFLAKPNISYASISPPEQFGDMWISTPRILQLADWRILEVEIHAS